MFVSFICLFWYISYSFINNSLLNLSKNLLKNLATQSLERINVTIREPTISASNFPKLLDIKLVNPKILPIK